MFEFLSHLRTVSEPECGVRFEYVSASYISIHATENSILSTNKHSQRHEHPNTLLSAVNPSKFALVDYEPLKLSSAFDLRCYHPVYFV